MAINFKRLYRSASQLLIYSLLCTCEDHCEDLFTPHLVHMMNAQLWLPVIKLLLP